MQILATNALRFFPILCGSPKTSWDRSHCKSLRTFKKWKAHAKEIKPRNNHKGGILLAARYMAQGSAPKEIR